LVPPLPFPTRPPRHVPPPPLPRPSPLLAPPFGPPHSPRTHAGRQLLSSFNSRFCHRNCYRVVQNRQPCKRQTPPLLPLYIIFTQKWKKESLFIHFDAHHSFVTFLGSFCMCLYMNSCLAIRSNMTLRGSHDFMKW
jgi:hypothetical protein